MAKKECFHSLKDNGSKYFYH